MNKPFNQTNAIRKLMYPDTGVNLVPNVVVHTTNKRTVLSDVLTGVTDDTVNAFCSLPGVITDMPLTVADCMVTFFIDFGVTRVRYTPIPPPEMNPQYTVDAPLVVSNVSPVL